MSRSTALRPTRAWDGINTIGDEMNPAGYFPPLASNQFNVLKSTGASSIRGTTSPASLGLTALLALQPLDSGCFGLCSGRDSRHPTVDP